VVHDTSYSAGTGLRTKKPGLWVGSVLRNVMKLTKLGKGNTSGKENNGSSYCTRFYYR
jgi:hypothetical protein